MISKKFVATAALLIAALGVSAGTAGASPEASVDNGAVNYAATTTEQSTIIKTDAGSMVVEDNVFKIKAANGTVVAGTELEFRVDDYVFPIAANISDRTATLTPEFVADKAVYKPVNLPFENVAPFKSEYDREQAAWKRMVDTISMGATVATLTGGLGGAALGCVIGAGVGFAATTPLLLMFGAGPLGGCIVGASLVGFIGTVAGQLLVTAPVAIISAFNYFITINQPFVAAK